VTPLHNALVDAMLTSRCHVIATMRSKVDYVHEVDPRTGKMVPRKVGLAPIQREGMDFEFDVVLDVTIDHDAIVGKTRCEEIDGKVFRKPGKDLADVLLAWLTDGVVETGPPVGTLPSEVAERLRSLIAEVKMTDHQVRSALAKRGASSIERLSVVDATDLINKLDHMASRARWSAEIGATAEEMEEAGQPVGTPTGGIPLANRSETEKALLKEAFKLIPTHLPPDYDLRGHLDCFGCESVHHLNASDLEQFVSQLRANAGYTNAAIEAVPETTDTDNAEEFELTGVTRPVRD